MCRMFHNTMTDRPICLSPGKSKGFSLVSVLFILVVLAALGGYIVKLSLVQHTTTSMSIQSARAWFAASSGLEWATYQINNGRDCAYLQGNDGFQVEGYSINVTECGMESITEGSLHYNMFRVSVEAAYGSFGSLDYSSRTITAVIKG
jgi:MSHA biogenesis protein MshP